MEEAVRKLRNQHIDRLNKGIYEEVLGNVCCNCGSTEDITYHHIVPLSQGGTNKLSNITPVCVRCHKAIHGWKEAKAYKSGISGGREPRIGAQKREELFWKYLNCEIDQPTLKEEMQLAKGSHISDMPSWRKFLKAHDIKKVKNNLAIIRKNGIWPPSVDTIVGYIEYKDGRLETILYGDTLRRCE